MRADCERVSFRHAPQMTSSSRRQESCALHPNHETQTPILDPRVAMRRLQHDLPSSIQNVIRHETCRLPWAHGVARLLWASVSTRTNDMSKQRAIFLEDRSGRYLTRTMAIRPFVTGQSCRRLYAQSAEVTRFPRGWEILSSPGSLRSIRQGHRTALGSLPRAAVWRSLHTSARRPVSARTPPRIRRGPHCLVRYMTSFSARMIV